MTHSEGVATPSKGRYGDSCGCTIFTDGGIILLRDVSTTEGGMTPSEGGIKAAEGNNIFP